MFCKKYNKYKLKCMKYEALLGGTKKTIQKAGFFLSDNASGLLFNTIASHLYPYNDYFKIENLPHGQYKQKTIYDIFNEKSYMHIYTKLINGYMIKTEYVQHSSGKSMIADHVNYANLIFISFLLEYELLCILHQTLSINTVSNRTQNGLQSMYCYFQTTCNQTRIYKDNILGKPLEIFMHFVKQLDKLFYYFMHNFIKNLIKMNKFAFLSTEADKYNSLFDELRNKIVDKKRSTSYEYINKEWRQQVQDFIGTITTMSDDTIYQNIISALEETFDGIETNEAPYTSEGTGFLSFVYLCGPDFDKPYSDDYQNPFKLSEKFNGSCITHSMFEFYIMARLHIPGKHMQLNLESEITRPGSVSLWHTTDTYLNNIPSNKFVSHWSTLYNFGSTNIKLRSGFPIIRTFIFDKLSDKKDIFRSLIYPIFDSYIHYLHRISDRRVDVLMQNFINDRVKMMEEILFKHYEEIVDVTEIEYHEKSNVVNMLQNIIPSANIKQGYPDIIYNLSKMKEGSPEIIQITK